jgi:ATP-dependent RNA helicase RhlE
MAGGCFNLKKSRFNKLRREKKIIMTTFKNLNLNEKILDALDKKGYINPTPIQLQAIPHVMEGKDLLGIAQTGTGKTAAFSLPMLHNLAKNPVSVKSGCMRVLILTPTRELASQIAENIEVYGKELGLRHAVMFGGVSERPQIATMQRGVDILIATPGRLLDLTNQGYIRYMNLEVFVLDEADRMLDMGFINDIKKIIQKIPEKRQTLFFSATMPSSISELANSILKSPVKVEVTPQSTTVEKIDQKVFLVDKSNKAALVKWVLKNDEVKHVLIFCKMKHGANKVVEHLLTHGIKVAAIHGNKSQSAREKALSDFRSGAIQVLVATDIAARGIDIPAISHVVNYDIPMDPESYVHRIGRTARAGREGVAISFCDPSEVKLLREVEKVISYKIPVDETHPFHGVAASATRDYDEPRERRRPTSSRPPRSGGGFSAGRNSRPSSNSSGRSDNRSRDNFKRDDRRSEPRRDSRGPDSNGGEKKILGFFGFGKNKTESHLRPRRDEGGFNDRRSSSSPREREDRRPDPARDTGLRFNDDSAKKKSFGFGWFKKSDSRDSSRSAGGFGARSSDSRRPNSDFGGGRARPSAEGGRKPFSNSGSSRPSSSGNRSGSSFGGGRSGGGSRIGGGKKW